MATRIGSGSWGLALVVAVTAACSERASAAQRPPRAPSGSTVPPLAAGCPADPNAPPADLCRAPRPGFVCTYPNGRRCACNYSVGGSLVWDCSGPPAAGCPLSDPGAGAACAVPESLACSYGPVILGCRGGAWRVVGANAH